MTVSRLKTMPTTRKAITTIAKPIKRVDEVMLSLEHKIQNGEKIYWICPLIERAEESEDFAVTDIITRANSLHDMYPGKVGVIHGKLSLDGKDEMMQKFKSGEIVILVATTIVEVGIDISDATLIIIENAEKFGLSQLHQLRGRVGRGPNASHCILLYAKAHDVAKQRIEIMRSSCDGFFIAEQDLLHRGCGEILGTKQSGEREFRFADITRDIDLLIRCNDEATKLAQSHNSYTEFLMRLFYYHDKHLL
jgi:ATP-dependent DNA helicase RecG